MRPSMFTVRCVTCGTSWWSQWARLRFRLLRRSCPSCGSAKIYRAPLRLL